MGKFSQISKLMKGKLQGKSEEEIAQEMMKDEGVQNMFAKIQKGMQEGKISQQELMEIQQKAQANPREAQKDIDELLKRVED